MALKAEFPTPLPLSKLVVKLQSLSIEIEPSVISLEDDISKVQPVSVLAYLYAAPPPEVPGDSAHAVSIKQVKNIIIYFI
jgi:hypothetical protein